MRAFNSRLLAWLFSPLLALALANCADHPTAPRGSEVLPSISPAATTGGPIVLMGIDAEDGGPGGHGPIGVYRDVVNSILAEVTNSGSGILVVGGGKNAFDNVTTFWDALGTIAPAVPITYVNGAANITAQSFAGFAMIGVVSSEFDTPFGGLTNAENDALAARQADIANFVNAGGGLLGFNAHDLTQPYGYLAGVGAFTFNFPAQYSNITPTPEGLLIGITDALDVCCWHDEYITFPSFLQVLATNVATGNAAAIGGRNVVVPPVEPEGCSHGYWKNHPAAWGPTGYTRNQTVGSVLGNANPYHTSTLEQALRFGGGPGVNGGKQILLRQAVAALLNAAHPEVGYPRTAASVASDVSAALGSNHRQTMLTLAGDLDADNNLGCPLN